MKTNLMAKCKWYIVGVIAIVMMLSVGLSLCSWDNLSVITALDNANTGKYDGQHYRLDEDSDNNGKVSVGDIVKYGRFFQKADALTTGELDELRWIVVDMDNTTGIATLMTEQVITYGTFYGLVSMGISSDNYYISTVRSWLNSGKGSLKGSGNVWNDNNRYDDNVRSDGAKNASGELIKFGINESKQMNKGFLDVAFSEHEKEKLVPLTISGLHGYGADSQYPNEVRLSKTSDGRDYVRDLVWLPSIENLYISTDSIDGASANKQFEYFDGCLSAEHNAILVSSATDYAWRRVETNFSQEGGTVNPEYDDYQYPQMVPSHDEGVEVLTGTRYRTRTSRKDTRKSIVHVFKTGSTNSTDSFFEWEVGVRPAVMVKI